MILELANPVWLALLALPLGWAAWYWLWYRPRRLQVRLSYDPAQLSRASILPALLRYLPYALLLAALTLMVLAMARPQRADTYELKEAEGVDLILALDVSESMETTDFLPNRMAVARQQAEAFIDGRRDDRIGLVIFAEHAVSLSPLTLDYDLLKRFIRPLEPGVIPKRGTAVGTAIAVSINRLRDSQSKSKAVILLTDGKATEGAPDPVSAAKLAAEFGIRIYTIAIGKESYRLPNGKVEYPDLDEGSLKEIARLSGGRFYRSTDPASLADVFAAIGNLERSAVSSRVFREVHDTYPQLLLAAFVCLSLGLACIALGWHNWLEE